MKKGDKIKVVQVVNSNGLRVFLNPPVVGKTGVIIEIYPEIYFTYKIKMDDMIFSLPLFFNAKEIKKIK